MLLHRQTAWKALTPTAALLLGVFTARAGGEEVSGVVKSVNADSRTFVLAPGGAEPGTTLTLKVEGKTLAEKAKKGKVVKKFRLDRLSPGGAVVVTHEKGVASRIVLKKGAYKKKTKA
jgi:hypothetical protein